MSMQENIIPNLQDFEKAVSQYPDNKEAWERACDLFAKTTMICAKDIDYCESSLEYFNKIYPTAVNAAEIIHVMATVPVYVLVQKDSNKKADVLVALTNQVDMVSSIPVFFTREDAESIRQDICQTTDDPIWTVRIPFTLLVDQEYGIFDDCNSVFPLVSLCDFRENKPWVVTSRNRIIMLILDACRALRSYFDLDILRFAKIVEQAKNEGYSEETLEFGESELPIF